MRVNADTPELLSYVAAVQQLYADFCDRQGYNFATKDTHYADAPGPKFIRIVAERHGQRMVHTFVNRETGDVHKAAGWKAPEKKNPRSNIFDADNGISGVEWTGAKYLR